MSIIKHKYINSAKKKTINKKKTKYKPINKTVRIGNIYLSYSGIVIYSYLCKII